MAAAKPLEFAEADADLASLSDDDVTESHDARAHNRLLSNIAKLDGKSRAAAQRSEPAAEVSEFHLFAVPTDKVALHQLVGALRNTASHGTLRKQLNRVQKKQSLNVPLSRPEQERIERTVAYDATTTEVSKWDPVVRENRKAEQLMFPLEQPDLRLITTEQAVKRFQPRTPLEVEIAKVLHGSDAVLTKQSVLTRAEERAMRAMDLREAQARRAELQRHRALLSYKEEKARRQNKIKSRKYHRVLRKEREKQERKNMQQLEKSDPEAYMQKLQQLDKLRLQERMSQKHRGGSRRMQKQMLYGKYDDNVRQAVQDMIQKNKELKQKTVVEHSDSDEEPAGHDGDDVTNQDGGELMDVALATTAASTGNNPWMLPPTLKQAVVYSRPQEVVNEEMQREGDTEATTPPGESRPPSHPDDLDIDDLFEEMQKKRKALPKDPDELEGFVEKKSRKKRKLDKLKAKRKAKLEAQNKAEAGETTEFGEDFVKLASDSEHEDEDKTETVEKAEENETEASEALIHQSLSRKRTLEDLEGDWSDGGGDVTGVKNVATEGTGDAERSRQKKKRKRKKKKEPEKSTEGADSQIDPHHVMTVETSMRSRLDPALVSDEDEQDPAGDEDRQRMTIAEAFADDDVTAEFDAAKRDAEEKEKARDIDLTLPGWGEWTGEGIPVSRRKKKRFIIRAPPGPPRKDRDLNHVIISESKDTSIAKHQVNSLPFPFRSVAQFESSVRAPLGKTWNPETAFTRHVKPKKVTRLGTIIEPIDKSVMYRKQQSINDRNKQRLTAKKNQQESAFKIHK